MKIICGTDFSERAQQATELAAALVARLQGTLVLVHAMEPWVPTFPPELATATYRIDVDRREILSRQLGEAGAALRKRGVAVETRLVDDYADRALVSVAHELGADLIVIGRRGRRAAERWLLGSVCEKVVEYAACPVLVTAASAAGLLDWLAHAARPLRLACAMDATRASDAALEWVRGFRARTACDVTFVSVYWPPEERLRLGAHGDPVASDPEIVAIRERDLRARVGALPGEGKVDIVVRPNWGRVGSALASVTADAQDLVVIGTHQRHGLARAGAGSVARDFLRWTDVPAIFVPMSRATQASVEPVLRNIVACTDLSETGDQAVRYAYALLRGRGGEVDIVYVASKSDEREGPRADELRRRLLALEPADAAEWGIATHAEITGGPSVPMAIAQSAERVGAQAIVVGARGRGGLARALRTARWSASSPPSTPAAPWPSCSRRA